MLKCDAARSLACGFAVATSVYCFEIDLVGDYGF